MITKRLLTTTLFLAALTLVLSLPVAAAEEEAADPNLYTIDAGHSAASAERSATTPRTWRAPVSR
jgi:hypothetical protein